MGDELAATRIRIGLALLVLMGAVAVVFASASRLPLMSDDYYYLGKLQHPGWWHSASIWGESGSANQLFRPVLYLWFGFLHRLFGLHPLPYHVVTGLIVVGAGVMTGLVGRRLGLGAGAYAAAAVFSLHASMATPVGWTSAVNSPLGVGLAMGALCLMLRPRVRPVDAAAASALFFAALMTREVVAIAPVMLVIGRYAIETVGPVWARLKRAVIVSLPLWLVAAVYLIVRRLAGFVSNAPAYQQRLGTQGIHNLGKLMAYATEFGYSGRDGALVTVFWVVLVSLCALAALRYGRPQGLVGLAWALLGALPVIFLATHPMAYYYLDFALPGVALAVGMVFQWLIDNTPQRDRIVVVGICFAALAGLSFYTVRREMHTFLNPEAALTRRVVEQVERENPHPAPGSTIVLPISAASAAYQSYTNVVRVIFHDPSLKVSFAEP